MVLNGLNGSFTRYIYLKTVPFYNRNNHLSSRFMLRDINWSKMFKTSVLRTSVLTHFPTSLYHVT